jgi:uncharacterized protein (UPF0332 family)
VRPETTGILDKAREFLLKAEDMFADNWPDEAGRAAYLAGLHAAQAVSSSAIKRHRGVRNELRRLLKDEPRFDLELQAFLGCAYNLKAMADCETGPAHACPTRSPASQSRPRAATSRSSLRCWHRVVSHNSPLFLRTVEQDPDAEILRDVLEAMRDIRGAEQEIAGADIAHPVLDSATAGPRGDEIELVAQVRHLRAIRRAGGEPHLQLAIDKHLGRLPRRPRQGQCCSKRRWGRCLIHRDSLPVAG